MARAFYPCQGLGGRAVDPRAAVPAPRGLAADDTGETRSSTRGRWSFCSSRSAIPAHSVFLVHSSFRRGCDTPPRQAVILRAHTPESRFTSPYESARPDQFFGGHPQPLGSRVAFGQSEGDRDPATASDQALSNQTVSVDKMQVVRGWFVLHLESAQHHPARPGTVRLP